MKVILVSGARPNFMKVAPLIWELNRRRSAAFPIGFRLVHTGQHYDRDMMSVFFDEFGLPQPDYDLGVGSGSHAVQTAKIMIAFERVCRPGVIYQPNPELTSKYAEWFTTFEQLYPALSAVSSRLHGMV